jgi:hypothetical protein
MARIAKEGKMQMLNVQQLANYDDLELKEFGESQRGRKKAAEAASRARPKKRSNRKRGGQSAIAGMSHRRLHRWS